MQTEEYRPTDREARLELVLAEYLRAADSGNPPDEHALLARHPDLADELKEFLANRAAMQRLTAPARDPGITKTLPAHGRPPRPLSTPDLSLPGAHQFGDYELLEEIARGGMGVVYKARQVSLHRVVALKMILSGQLASAGDVQRFRTEAEAAASLDHPNIVPIYEIGEQDGQHFFSMRLIEGGNFGKLIRKHLTAEGAGERREAGESLPLRFSAPCAVKILLKVARAVHHAHQRGILHRDLKPANILIDRDGEPHVTDFGLAKRVGTEAGLTQQDAIVGTPSYMAPEQALAERRLTTAVDVYALGAILYECLTGRPPFRGLSGLEVLKQVVEAEPEAPRSLNARLDRDLETICLKCLQKEPAKRYGSAEALADDLQRWLDGKPIRARRTGSAERLLKWARRHPGVAFLLTSVVVLTATTLASVTWEWRQAQAMQGELTRSLYFRTIAGAAAELAANNVTLAEHLLESPDCAPALRGWEWHYLKRLRPEYSPRLGEHDSGLTAVAYHP